MSLSRKNFSLLTDYAIIEGWWNAQGSYPPKPEQLPSTGFIVEESGTPVCAGFLYRTDSSICVFEFVVSNPEATKEQRDTALSYLIESAKEWAESEGFNLIYTSVGIPKYVSRLKYSGFVEADREQTHLFYEVT